MVGALKSNRCETCRKRKVKCDEAWPICGPCKRSHRYCPPRSSLKVIDDGARVRRQLAAASHGKMDSQTEASQDGCGLWLQEAVPLSSSQRLCYAFINCLNTQNPSHSVNYLGASLSLMPQRFGFSAALDDVAACMVASHSTVTRGVRPSWYIKPQLYARALRSLQHAIDDPNEWKSSNTLCAILLLHRTESVFGGSCGPNALVHGSGMATLLQKRGPPSPSNNFDCVLVTDSHMCIVEHALLRRKDCFLAEREWSRVLDAVEGRTHLQTLYYRLLRQMRLWSTLVQERLDLSEGDPNMTRKNSFTLLKRANQVKTRLYEIDLELDALVKDNNLVTHIPSMCLTDLVLEMLELRDSTVAVVLCYHAMYSIMWSIINDDSFYKSELEFEILCLSRKIWELVEHGRRYQPLGLPILSVALSMTLESVSWEAQNEITTLVNELESVQGLKSASWTTEKLIHLAMVYRGDRAADI